MKWPRKGTTGVTPAMQAEFARWLQAYIRRYKRRPTASMARKVMRILGGER